MWVTLRQTRCLVYKSFLLKKRDKKQFLQELLYPIYMVGILAMIRAFVRPQEFPVIRSFPQLELDDIKTRLSINDSTIIYAPSDNADVVRVMNKTQSLLGLVNPPLGFINGSVAEDYYKNASKSQNIFAAVIFDSFSTANTSYTIRMPDGLLPASTETIRRDNYFSK